MQVLVQPTHDYVDWVRRFIFFHNKRHPEQMGRGEVSAFIQYLAGDGGASAFQRAEAERALRFLYAVVLAKPLEAKTPPAYAGGSPGNAGGSPGNAGGSPGNAGGSPGNAGGSPGNAGGSPGNAGGSPESFAAPKLLDQMREILRVRHYARRTEDCYVDWSLRYILFHNKRHPAFVKLAAAVSSDRLRNGRQQAMGYDMSSGFKGLKVYQLAYIWR